MKMNYEQVLLEAFRGSDERGRQSILDYAISMAEDWPAGTDSAALTLPIVDDPACLPGGDLHDLESPTVISPPK